MLVAKLGEIKTAHFAHHTIGECAGAWETTLHLLAKEVLLGARHLLLPEAVAEFEGATKEISGATWFPYSAVREEVDLGSIRPDIILAGRRELLVEVAVTHFCDQVKIAKLRDRDLPAIEIDLSSVPRLATRDEHARIILGEAPRIWLHNARIASAENTLRAEAEQRRAEQLDRRKVGWSIKATKLAETVAESLEPHGGPWVSEAQDAGLGRFLGREVEGDFCFAVARETWQARLIAYAWKDRDGDPFTLDDAFARMRSQGLLHSGFEANYWPEEEVEFLRTCLPGFTPAQAVLATYANLLAKEGFLWAFGDGHFFVPPEPIQRAKEITRKTHDARLRRHDLNRLLNSVKGGLGPMAEEIASRWIEAPLPGGIATPASVAEQGGGAWTDLYRAMQGLADMVMPNGEPIPPEKLLCLPLEEVRLKRIAEAERRDAERSKRRRQTAVAFIVEIRGEAERELGKEEGTAWVKARLGDTLNNLGSDDRLEPDAAFRRDMETALGAKVNRVRAARDAETDLILAGAQKQLQHDALRQKLTRIAHAKFQDAEKANVWMRSKHPGLGSSPLEACTSEGGLERCSRVLEAPRRR